MYNPLLNKKPYGASVANMATSMVFRLTVQLASSVFSLFSVKFSEKAERETARRSDLNCPIKRARGDKTFLSERLRSKSGAFGNTALKASLKTVIWLSSAGLWTGRQFVAIGCRNGS